MNLRRELETFIARVQESEGTNIAGAVRDILTDLKHVCDGNHLDFEERVATALEVAKQEDEQDETQAREDGNLCHPGCLDR